MKAALDLRSAQGLIALQRLPHVGRAKALRAALSGRAPDETFVGPAGDANLVQAYQWAERELSRWRRAGVEPLTFFDPRFPLHLSGIADPPVVLFVRGNA